LKAEELQRDSVKVIRWQIDEPSYRVDFWHQFPPPPGGRAEMMGYKQDAYRVSGVDSVTQVLSWAEENALGRLFVVYAELLSEGGPGVVRLHGVDPTATT
jgi:hypothetical protein